MKNYIIRLTEPQMDKLRDMAEVANVTVEDGDFADGWHDRSWDALYSKIVMALVVEEKPCMYVKFTREELRALDLMCEEAIGDPQDAESQFPSAPMRRNAHSVWSKGRNALKSLHEEMAGA